MAPKKLNSQQQVAQDAADRVLDKAIDNGVSGSPPDRGRHRLPNSGTLSRMPLLLQVVSALPLPCDNALALSKGASSRCCCGCHARLPACTSCNLAAAHLPAVVVKANAKDIVKKSTTRKNRWAGGVMARSRAGGARCAQPAGPGPGPSPQLRRRQPLLTLFAPPPPAGAGRYLMVLNCKLAPAAAGKLVSTSS
jgi:hypothetical protein